MYRALLEFAQQASDHDPPVARFAIGAAPAARLAPLFECLVRQGTRNFSARFGYDNPNLLPVSVAVGAQKRFFPAPADRGQPIVFQPGRHTSVFTVALDSVLLSWSLNGRAAIASPLSRRCQ